MFLGQTVHMARTAASAASSVPQVNAMVKLHRNHHEYSLVFEKKNKSKIAQSSEEYNTQIIDIN